jgi:hypothetical protein
MHEHTRAGLQIPCIQRLHYVKVKSKHHILPVGKGIKLPNHRRLADPQIIPDKQWKEAIMLSLPGIIWLQYNHLPVMS